MTVTSKHYKQVRWQALVVKVILWWSKIALRFCSAKPDKKISCYEALYKSHLNKWKLEVYIAKLETEESLRKGQSSILTKMNLLNVFTILQVKLYKWPSFCGLNSSNCEGQCVVHVISSMDFCNPECKKWRILPWKIAHNEVYWC